MSVTTTRRVTMQFDDTLGESFNVSLSKVKDLTDAAGQTLVKDAMDAMMTEQPYTSELAAKSGAWQTVTTKTDINVL